VKRIGTRKNIHRRHPGFPPIKQSALDGWGTETLDHNKLSKTLVDPQKIKGFQGVFRT
jgi:hypothetical protein